MHPWLDAALAMLHRIPGLALTLLVVVGVLILIALIAFVIFLIRVRLSRDSHNEKGEKPKDKVEAKAKPEQLKQSGSKARKPNWGFLVGSLKLLACVAGIGLVIWFGPRIWHGVLTHLPRNNTPSMQSAAGMYARQDEVASATLDEVIPAGGMISIPAASTSTADDAWSVLPEPIPLRLRICRDAQHGTGSYKVQCHDRHAAASEWRDFSEASCSEADLERYQSEGESQTLKYFFVRSQDHC